MQKELKSYTPDHEEMLLLRALLGEEHSARQAALAWLDGTDLLSLNEGLRRLVPFLHHRMTGWNLLHPKRPQVASIYRHYWLASHRTQHQCDKLIDVLAALKVPIVLLKGASLGRTVYTSLALRPLSDIDVLISPGDFAAVLSHLVSSGFEIAYRSPHAFLLRKAGYPEIDLHRSPFHEACTEDAVLPIFTRTVPLGSAVRHLHRLSDEDQLLHTLAHGMRWNLVSPLRWVVDAMQQIRASGPSFDWDLFCREAVRLDIVEVASRGLMILDSMCPDEIDRSPITELNKRRNKVTQFWFRAEREWQGPSVVWGRARRERGGWFHTAGVFIQHFRNVAAQQGMRYLVGKAISFVGEVCTKAFRHLARRHRARVAPDNRP